MVRESTTDLEVVVTVKFKAFFRSSNGPVVDDLAGLGAFWDLEQAVCGRDKLVVACEDRLVRKESVAAPKASTSHQYGSGVLNFD